MGLADRILLVIGSDFGRTNFINETNGKDHWPIGSYILMEQGAPWGDRVIGKTDDFILPALSIPRLCVRAPQALMTPHHIHASIRDYLGLTQFATEAGFDTNVGIPLPLFEPFLST